MNEIIIFGLMALAGHLVKFTDQIVDANLKVPKKLKYVFGLAYGILIGTLIVFDARIAVLGIAVLLANFIYGRFDDAAHRIALAAIVALALVFGIPQINLMILVVLFLGAVSDEFFNDIADKNKFKSKILNKFFHHRLLLWAAAIAVSLAFWDAFYIIGILCFDIAYKITELFTKKRINK